MRESLCLLSVSLALGACSGIPSTVPSNSPSTGPSTAVATPTLAGTSWRLASFQANDDGSPALRTWRLQDNRLHTGLPADAGVYVWERITP